MKTLKFHPGLISLILSGEKTSTWRLFDDKDLQEGDRVVCLNSKTQVPFAEIVLTRVKDVTFQELSEEDKKGHEEFINDEEMLDVYSQYYNIQVTFETPFKIVRFKLVK